VKIFSSGLCFAQKRKALPQNIPRIAAISIHELFWRVDFQNVQDIAQNNAGVDFRTLYGQDHSLKSKDNDFIASGHHQTLILHKVIIYFHKKVWVDVAVKNEVLETQIDIAPSTRALFLFWKQPAHVGIQEGLNNVAEILMHWFARVSALLIIVQIRK
jgi:hypothetical protein